MFDLINQNLASSLGTHAVETLKRRLAGPGISVAHKQAAKLENELRIVF